MYNWCNLNSVDCANVNFMGLTELCKLKFCFIDLCKMLPLEEPRQSVKEDLCVHFLETSYEFVIISK